MLINEEVFETIERLEKGLCGDVEAALSNWIDVADELNGQRVVSLLNKLFEASDGANVVKIKDRLEHVALVDLVKTSPLAEIINYSSEASELMLIEGLRKEDVQRIAEIIRTYRITFS